MHCGCYAYGDTASSGRGHVDACQHRNVRHVCQLQRSPPACCGTAFNGRDYDGKLAEVIIYDRELAPDELNFVGNYLSVKYGIESAYTPEPATMALLGVGLLALARRRRR